MRYSYASKLTDGRIVLDIGSGVGEGAELLGQHASLVVGLDQSFVAVKYAQETYGARSSKLSFVVASGEELPFRPRAFDAVVMFEVIEHVDDYDRLLEEVSLVAHEGSIVIASTPNKSFSSPGLRNPITLWHTREFYVDEFVSIVKGRFQLDETFGIACRHRRRPLNRGPFYPVLKSIDLLPREANMAARRFLSSRLGYSVLDFVYGKPDVTKLWIERESLGSAYCVVAICSKRSGLNHPPGEPSPTKQGPDAYMIDQREAADVESACTTESP